MRKNGTSDKFLDSYLIILHVSCCSDGPIILTRGIRLHNVFHKGNACIYNRHDVTTNAPHHSPLWDICGAETSSALPKPPFAVENHCENVGSITREEQD